MVPYAVVWRVLEVHQVVLAGPFEVCVRGSEPSAVLVDGHLHGAVIPLAKVVSRAPEVGHGQPAGPNAARPADAVTFTLQGHEALHRLARRAGVNREEVSEKIVCGRCKFELHSSLRVSRTDCIIRMIRIYSRLVFVKDRFLRLIPSVNHRNVTHWFVDYSFKASSMAYALAILVFWSW